MKKIYFIPLYIFFLFLGFSKSQTIWFEGFETTLPNNLPSGWSFYDNTGHNFQPDTMWTVRDSGSQVPGVNAIRRAIPYAGFRVCGVSWLVGTGDSTNIGDAWLVSKRIVNVPADGLIGFYASGGTPTLRDSLQLWVSHVDSLPSSFLANQSNYIMTIAFPPNPNYPSYSDYYIDLAPYAGQTIWIGFRYYIDVAVDGVYVQVDNVSLTGTIGIQQLSSNVPDKFNLNQNYPNPFNPNTRINFDLAKNTKVKLTIFNSLGQVVQNLFDGYKTAGSYSADFNAGSLASGTYFYRLETEYFTETKRMLLVK